MKTWSVEHECNSYNDDLFNGTFDECLAYCKKQGYEFDGSALQLAEIEVDENGCSSFCYDIVSEI